MIYMLKIKIYTIVHSANISLFMLQNVAKIISKDQIQHAFDNATKDYRFAASVAAFGQLLRQSPHLNNFSFDKLRAMAKQATGSDNFGYRQEFIRLIEVAESLNQIERATLTPQTDHGRG